MQLLQKFTQYITTENLFQQKDKLLLAVSGGVDSVVLCELFKQAGYQFAIAHCNFALRAEESERDEAFVRGLGKKYEVQTFVKKFETEKYAGENKLSIQVAARELRYEWFYQLIGNKQMAIGKGDSNCQMPVTNWIVTAHHADDNVETLLMNFFKGTGITGLQGIPHKQNKIVRPLLFARKEEIKQFAEENRLSFVEDSSNASDKYTRNYFRNQLIPSIKTVFPEAEENLRKSIKRFREIETLYEQAISLHKKRLIEIKGEEIHIPTLKLAKSEPLATIVYEIIKDFGFAPNQAGEVIKLLSSDSGKYIQSSSHRILKNRKWIIISPLNSTIAENIVIEESCKKMEFAAGTFRFEKLSAEDYQLSTNNSVAMLDADVIEFPLLLRKWKQGDYFYPLGMKKKKKLSRFFIDQKLSLTEKENVWVLETNKKITWVVGKRIDDRFKVTPGTKNIIKISLS